MEMRKVINDADGDPALEVEVNEYQEDAFGVTIVSLIPGRPATILTPKDARLLIAALSEAATMAESNRREFDGTAS